jgi:hypothetical protein
VVKEYNFDLLAAQLKCDKTSSSVWEFLPLWQQAVHSNCLYMFTRFDREARAEVAEFFDTETSATSLKGTPL